MTRKYTDVKVSASVRCMSDGHHWFHVRYTAYQNSKSVFVWRDYNPSVGFAGLGYALGWQAPKYLIAEVDRQIGQMCRDNQFKVYECDRDGNERYDDLRYHDPDVFKWYAENYK